jgi:hypothetical protein
MHQVTHQPCQGAPGPGKAGHKDAHDRDDADADAVRHGVAHPAAKVLVQQEAHGNLGSNHLQQPHHAKSIAINEVISKAASNSSKAATTAAAEAEAA